MALTGGDKLLHLERFLTERHGPGAYRRLVAEVDPRWRGALSAVDPATWYDLRLHAELTRAACALFGGVEVARAVGRFEADIELTRTRRWVLRLVPPAFALRSLGVSWRRGQDTGGWSIDVGPSFARVALSGGESREPMLCQRVLGFVGRALEHVGLDVRRMEHSRCRLEGGDACWFDAFCAPIDESARPPPPLRRSDIPALLIELARVADPALIGDAIVRVFSEVLGFSRVELLLADGGRGRLVRAPNGKRPRATPTERSAATPGDRAGAPSGERPAPTPGDRVGAPSAAAPRGEGGERRFVLQTGGRVLGHIDVVSPGGVPERAASAIAELLPGLSLALATALPPMRWSAAATPAARRAAAVRRAWGLTGRQAAVLSLIAEGRTNRAIGHALGCTEGAVEQHVAMLFRKSGAADRGALLRRFWLGA